MCMNFSTITVSGVEFRCWSDSLDLELISSYKLKVSMLRFNSIASFTNLLVEHGWRRQ